MWTYSKLVAGAALAVCCVLPAPVEAQIPVIDNLAISKLILQLKSLAEQIKILREQLLDMHRQAGMGSAPWNEDTAELLREQGQYGTNGVGLLYGMDNLESRMNDHFAGAAPSEQGRWLESSIARDEAVLETQKKLAHLLTMRNEAFEADNARIARLQHTVDGTQGRNALLKATAGAQVEALQQQQMEQQISLTIANAQAVQNAYETNERMAREAQERYFLSNGGKTPERPVFVDRGL